MNFDHRADRKLITGKAGSGKTTYFLRYLVRHRADWKLCFDPEREIARKLRWPVCTDVPSLNAAVVGRSPVCFDSTPLFPGDREGGFAFFCRWAFAVCKELNGIKLIAVDELQSVQRPGPGGIPTALAEMMDEGRRHEIDCLFIAQGVHRVHEKIRTQLTEIITFCHTDRLPLAWLAQDGFVPEEVAALRYPGGFIRRNLHTGQVTHADPTRKGNRPPVAP